MKPDQERVKNLLTDTVTLLCRNGLSFRDELRVEGLIGITLDNNEVFLVHLNERVNTAEDSASMSAPVAAQEVEPEPAPKVQKTATRNIKTESPVPSPRRAEKRSHSVMSDNTPGSSADMPVLIENIKQEGVKVKQEVINSEQRVPPLHGPPEGAMNSPMNTSSGAMNTPSSSKRRASSNTSMDNSSGETGGGMFITGMVRNLATQMGQGDASWNSSGLSDLMQQMAEGQLPGLEGQSPVPNWPMTPGGGLMPPGTPQSLNQDAMNSLLEGLVSQGRRSARDGNKPYVCHFPGCGLTFFHRQNLWRHKKKQGHRVKDGAAMATDPSGYYNNYGNMMPPPDGGDEDFDGNNSMGAGMGNM